MDGCVHANITRNNHTRLIVVSHKTKLETKESQTESLDEGYESQVVIKELADIAWILRLWIIHHFSVCDERSLS